MRCVLLLLLVVVGCKTEAARPAPAPPPAAPAPAVPVVRLESSAHESSGLVLARVDGKLRAFVADEDDGAVDEIDPETRTVVATTVIGARPRDLIVLADGRLAATLPDANAVAVFTRDAAAKLTEAQRVKTPPEPMSMAKSEDGAVLVVTTGASHSLLRLDAKLEEQARIDLGRDPRAALIQGERTYVTHATEDFVSVIGTDATVARTDISNRTTCRDGGKCTSARTARNAQAIVRSGEDGIVVPAAQAMPIPAHGGSKRALCPPPRRLREGGTEIVPPAGAAQDDGGYGFGDGENGPPVTADLAVLDAKTGKKWGTALPPDMGAGCILPRAAVASGDTVFVACLGSARVVHYSVRKAQYEDDAWDSASYGHFGFGAKGKMPRLITSQGVHPNLDGIKIDVPGGPSALAIGRNGDDEASLFVWSQFARTLSVVRNSRSESLVVVPRIVTRDEAWLAGRTLFYANGDDRISKDGRACASCHIDGTDDGLAWKTPRGERRTRFLRGEVADGPYGWTGEHATLAEHIQTTTKNLKGKGLPEADIAKLATYVASLPARNASRSPTPGPTPAAERGKAIFASAECNHCHSDGGTDRQLHDVGTGGSFKTPTLASVGTRRALGHGGVFSSIDDMLVHSPNMGRGSELPPDDRASLIAYLETL